MCLSRQACFHWLVCLVERQSEKFLRTYPRLSNGNLLNVNHFELWRLNVKTNRYSLLLNSRSCSHLFTISSTAHQISIENDRRIRRRRRRLPISEPLSRERASTVRMPEDKQDRPVSLSLR